MEALYEATEGPRWTENTNWKSSAPLGDWYGVDVDDGGRVSVLRLRGNALSGTIPPELATLESLRRADFSYNWGLTGSLPRLAPALEELDLLVTQACLPVIQQISFDGQVCGEDAAVTIDVAVVYTHAVRAAAGSAAAIEDEIEDMFVTINQAFATSGVRHNFALVAASEVNFDESAVASFDLRRFASMVEVLELRDRVRADLVHLLVYDSDECGIAYRPGAFSLTRAMCGAIAAAHELAHNMGLRHDRYQMQSRSPDPAFGYVNPQAFEFDALPESRWRTLMSSRAQCSEAGLSCSRLFRLSNPHQFHGTSGDPLGVAFGSGTESADAVSVLNTTGPAVARWR